LGVWGWGIFDWRLSIDDPSTLRLRSVQATLRTGLGRSFRFTVFDFEGRIRDSVWNGEKDTGLDGI